FQHLHVLGEGAVEGVELADAPLEPGALAHDRLRLLRALPEIRVLCAGVQLGEAGRGGVVVKDASAAASANP
ncbi:MAG: hypothetical protein J5W83_19930, partial [Candidatus Accumulibacter sp.]|uniref:hypothetical protein n=1 Tax=Accumulibacter sp. TaxID=2053492 RepID=UPI001B1E9EF6